MTRLLAALRDFFRIPELAPGDPRGWSDRELAELRILELHEAGLWE